MKIEIKEADWLRFMLIFVLIIALIIINLMYFDRNETRISQVIVKEPVITQEYRDIIVQINNTESDCLRINGQEVNKC